MSTFLSVPQISQVDDPGAKAFANDCGPASVAMILGAYGKLDGKSINDLYRETGNKRDRYTDYNQLAALLRARGLSSYFKYGSTRGRLFETIQEGRLSIVLIKYSELQSLNPQSNFKDMHFFVVVGFDLEHVIVNDPLWRGQAGKAWRIPWTIFEKAWSAANPGKTSLTINASMFDKFDEAEENEYRVTSRGNGLAVRPGASIGYRPVIKRLKAGTSIIVHETKENYDGAEIWGRIGKDQWVAIKYYGRVFAEKK